MRKGKGERRRFEGRDPRFEIRGSRFEVRGLNFGLRIEKEFLILSEAKDHQIEWVGA